MFQSEGELQKLIHDRPELLLGGILEISPQLSPDVPRLVSLGREIRLSSGAADNLFVDTNAVLTFVECKLYGNRGLKREVYSQAINYASDLQSRLIHFDGEEFLSELEDVLCASTQSAFSGVDAAVDSLEHDEVLEGSDTRAWREQFHKRLEHNIKSGIYRVCVLCGPTPRHSFSPAKVRNLMRLMSFSEFSASRYDLLLMDIRELGANYRSRIIWRRYAELPQIPLIAQARQKNEAITEATLENQDSLPDIAKSKLEQFLNALDKRGIMATAITTGYALKWEDSGKSLYEKILITKDDWFFNRHQIHEHESIFSIIDNEAARLLDGWEFKTFSRSSSIADKILEVRIFIQPDDDMGELADLATHLSVPVND